MIGPKSASPHDGDIALEGRVIGIANQHKHPRIVPSSLAAACDNPLRAWQRDPPRGLEAHAPEIDDSDPKQMLAMTLGAVWSRSGKTEHRPAQRNLR